MTMQINNSSLIGLPTGTWIVLVIVYNAVSSNLYNANNNFSNAGAGSARSSFYTVQARNKLQGGTITKAMVYRPPPASTPSTSLRTQSSLSNSNLTTTTTLRHIEKDGEAPRAVLDSIGGTMSPVW